MSLLLVPMPNVNLHNHPPPPQQNTKKTSAASIPSCHVFFTSCRVVASRPTRFVCLFVRLFVCLFVCLVGWLLRRLSAPCCCFPFLRVATPHRCAALCLSLSLLSCHCQIIASSRLISSSLSCCCVVSRSSCVVSHSVVILLPRFI